jgi:hypothetical protein
MVAQSPNEKPAQKPANKTNELRYNFNEDGSHFFKMTIANQAWLRQTWNNPGTTVGGTPAYQTTALAGKPEAQTFDIGLRRTRIQLFGQLNDHMFIYLQMGQNNFGYLSQRKFGFFLHDAVSEYNVNKHIGFGAGLTAWTGFSRFSSPAIASFLGFDTPLFLQATNDANDQFLRKLSAYAKGKLGKLDYRIVLSKPFDFVSSLNNPNTALIGTESKFSAAAPEMQTSGYFSYQFLDQESNQTPYQNGTYLGTKKVFNVGAGYQFQPKAMWHTEGVDTVFQAMTLASVDVFYDAPLNAEKGNAISVYAVATHYDFGKNYIRNIGVFNPADGTVNSKVLPGGWGDAFPMIGTGNSLYAQAGYLFAKSTNKPNMARFQPFVTAQYSMYEKLKDPMFMWETGIAILFDGHRSKLTLGYQDRPVFEKSGNDFIETTRRGMLVAQYQVGIL